MYSNNRNNYRDSFIQTWQKYLAQEKLSPLEKQILEVIILHPEYHQLLQNGDTAQNFELEENPFLHMGLHLAIREQIQLDRPQGINAIFTKLIMQYQNPLEVEHLMMTCMANLLWQAQQTGTMPSDAAYLEMLGEIK